MSSAYSATRWVLLSSFGFRFLSLGGQMLILRLVDKEDFGVYRGLVLIHLILLIALPLSLDSLVVRERARMTRYIVALANVLTWMGAAFAGILLLLSVLPAQGEANLMAWLMSLGSDYLAIYAMPAIVLFQAAKLSARAVLTARMDFRTISIGEFGNGMITWLGGAAVVLLYPTSWALMILYLLGEVFECWWLHRRFHRIFPRIASPSLGRFSLATVRRHLSYCLFNTSNLLFNNIASLLPGILFIALISKESNADYAVALQLLVLPTMLLAGALWRVAFPSLTGVSEDELKRRCISIMGGASAFIGPSVIWFAVFAPSTVMVLAGPAYLQTTPSLVRWMTLYMLMVSIYMPISSLDMIRNRPDVGLYWNVVYTIGRVALIYLFAADGLLATIAAISILSTAMWIVHIYIYGWLLGAPWGEFLGPVLRLTPTLGGFAAALWLCQWATGYSLLYAPLLSAVPCLVYLLVIWKFHPAESAMLRKLLRR